MPKTHRDKTLLDAYNRGRADAIAEMQTPHCDRHADTPLKCQRCEQARRGAVRTEKRAAASRANGAKRWADKRTQIGNTVEEPALCIAGASTIDGVHCDDVACVCQTEVKGDAA